MCGKTKLDVKGTVRIAGLTLRGDVLEEDLDFAGVCACERLCGFVQSGTCYQGSFRTGAEDSHNLRIVKAASMGVAAEWATYLARQSGASNHIELRDSRVHSQTTLDDWVNATCNKEFKATDPRDYIFALLGISHDGDSIVPDYELSTWEVYLLAMSPRSPIHKTSLLWWSYLADLMGIPKDRARDVWHSSSEKQLPALQAALEIIQFNST